MKAWVIRDFGGPEVFEEAEIDKPAILPNHILVKVHATSVNPIDIKIRSGLVKAIAAPFPAVLHSDFSGIVEEVGEGVTTFSAGDEVYGCSGGMKGVYGGALAEYLLVDANLAAKKPKNLSMRDAAACPLVSITAWVALFEKAGLKEGQSILIHGGVGGVGHIALQLAKWKKAHIFTTVGSEKDVSLAKSMGADEVIHYRLEEVKDYVKRCTDDQGFDVIFDTVGGKNLVNSFFAGGLNSVVATTAARATEDLTPLHQKGMSLHAVFMLIPLIHNIHREGHGIILEEVRKLIEENALKPLIDNTSFSVDQVIQAHAHLESGNAKGKVVLSHEI